MSVFVCQLQNPKEHLREEEVVIEASIFHIELVNGKEDPFESWGLQTACSIHSAVSGVDGIILVNKAEYNALLQVYIPKGCTTLVVEREKELLGRTKMKVPCLADIFEIGLYVVKGMFKHDLASTGWLHMSHFWGPLIDGNVGAFWYMTHCRVQELWINVDENFWRVCENVI